MVCDMLKTF